MKRYKIWYFNEKYVAYVKRAVLCDGALSFFYIFLDNRGGEWPQN